uniref:aminodeoxychorismate synthase n=1 Tax=Psilocybe cubensis TaxID=181762 RepID=A0A8H7Y5F3_PSICU
MTIQHPRLLLVDSYDSFTHNLAALFRQAIPNVSITIIKNDNYRLDELRPYLPYFSFIVIGPGPGSPDNAEDIGVVRDLWSLKDQDILPIFGVCLGLQSLSIAHGARLKRLNVVKHGLTSLIEHKSTDLFSNVGSVKAVRYHSLHVDLEEGGDIEELAWTHDEGNGKVVMAVRHKHRPFWAVQYHPESVCTDGGGVEVIRNFWKLAQFWSNDQGRGIIPGNHKLSEFGTPWPYLSPPSSLTTPVSSSSVLTLSLERNDLGIVDICECFGASDETSNFALLESASNPGRYSILGCLSTSTLQIKYRVGESFLSLTKNGGTTRENLGELDIWAWLSNFMQTKSYRGDPCVPFWGGFVGYLSYELGLQTLHVPLRRDTDTPCTNKHPDVNLVFVERSIVIDSHTSRIFVQSIAPDDDLWVSETFAKLEYLPPSSSSAISPHPVTNAYVMLPDKFHYISKIKQAKEHLFAGDSYELCVTAPTRISAPPLTSKPSKSSSWERYKCLRRSNPAPHSAYLRLHPSTLLSSSPERFLSYSRSPGSTCQLRPIKGTIRKGPNVTRAVAERELVGNPKEVAENLMIVDLIRHDLHGVIGEDVLVKQFCSLEEYETVWQLVSVIEGKLDDNFQSSRPTKDILGWRVLKESLPPGSMTGAPKKRSVEILQNLEGEERGIYSGVFGYWCVGGKIGLIRNQHPLSWILAALGAKPIDYVRVLVSDEPNLSGDWSVTIRSCFKFDEEGTLADPEDLFHRREEWTVGAGGAITALSDPENEWDEMVTKLQSVLRSFGVQAC